MSTTDVPTGEAKDTTKGETKTVDSSKSGRKIIILGILACVIILAATGVGVYFGTRPETIEVTTSTATDTLPTVVKAAKIDESSTGVVTIEYTNLLSDRSVISYYLNIENFNLSEFSLAEARLENLAVYLTRSAEPNVDNLGEDFISISNIAGQELPYRLQDRFVPGDYNGVLFGVEDNSITAVSSLESVASSEFSVIVDPDQNIASRPPALIASLSGEYGLAGTLKIDYRNDLVNGQIQSVPILEVDLYPRFGRAPGPYLYLSKRPYGETRHGRLTNDEIFIPIDSAADGGSFSVNGNFEQVLDEIGDVYDLGDYQNGSWVVWCRPFSVWIGGGPIEIV